MITTDIKELQTLCREWQERLNLMNWTVKVEIKRHYNMDDDLSGLCTTRLKLLEAWIDIRHPDEVDPESLLPYDMEKTLVHELLHIHFAPFFEDDPSQKLKNLAQEQAIEQIAKALVKLKREAHPQPSHDDLVDFVMSKMNPREGQK